MGLFCCCHPVLPSCVHGSRQRWVRTVHTVQDERYHSDRLVACFCCECVLPACFCKTGNEPPPPHVALVFSTPTQRPVYEKETRQTRAPFPGGIFPSRDTVFKDVGSRAILQSCLHGESSRHAPFERWKRRPVSWRHKSPLSFGCVLT